MLPTHIVRVQDNSTAADISCEGDMSAYPPLHGRESTNGNAVKRKTSVQSRLCGSRGVTAFTIQVQTPYKDSAEAFISPNKPQASTSPLTGARKSRWNTWEFYFYALVFAIAVPYMCWVPMRLSESEFTQKRKGKRWVISEVEYQFVANNINFPRYSWQLKRGWLFGRLRVSSEHRVTGQGSASFADTFDSNMQDDSDFQYRSFRDYLPVLTLMMVLHVAISKTTERLGSSNSYQNLGNAIHRPNRTAFLTVFTAIFILALHGTNSIKLLFFCTLNYVTVKGISATSFSPITPLIVWVLNISSLFLIHWNHGFPYESMSSSLAFLVRHHASLRRVL